jgi:hypothetical protein
VNLVEDKGAYEVSVRENSLLNPVNSCQLSALKECWERIGGVMNVIEGLSNLPDLSPIKKKSPPTINASALRFQSASRYARFLKTGTSQVDS